MRIFFFVDYWPLPHGGMETHAHEYITHIRKNTEHELEIIGFSDTAPLPTIQKNTDPKLTVLPKKSIHSPEILVRILKNKRIVNDDVLFFNSLYWIETFELLARNFPKNNILLRSGGNDILQSHILRKGKALKTRRKYTVRTINKYVSSLIINSEYSRRCFRTIGINESKFHIAQGGVDVDRFKPAVDIKSVQKLRATFGLLKDELVLLTVCRLVPFKGVDNLLTARSLLDKEEQYMHMIVGNGPELEKLKNLAQKLGLEKRTIFVGDVDVAQVHKLYQLADVYAHTPIRSRMSEPGGSYIHTETMGRSFCEASSTGVPIITTTVGGVPEIVTHKKNGLLVAPKDHTGIATALRTLARSQTMRGAMSKNGLLRREKFSWTTLFTQYEKIMDAYL